MSEKIRELSQIWVMVDKTPQTTPSIRIGIQYSLMIVTDMAPTAAATMKSTENPEIRVILSLSTTYSIFMAPMNALTSMAVRAENMNMMPQRFTASSNPKVPGESQQPSNDFEQKVGKQVCAEH